MLLMATIRRAMPAKVRHKFSCLPAAAQDEINDNIGLSTTKLVDIRRDVLTIA